MNPLTKAQIFHQAAMDFYDIGRVSKAKGNIGVFEEYLPLAFRLDKEAAYLVQSDTKDSLWKYMYPRSAVWLAIECKLYEEALPLVQLALSGTPPAHEKYELEKALKIITAQTTDKLKTKTNNSFQFEGTLTKIDLDEKKLFVRPNVKKQYRVVNIPIDFNQMAIGILLGRWVKVEVYQEEKDVFVLKNIQPAA